MCFIVVNLVFVMTVEGKEEVSSAFWVLSQKIAAYGPHEPPAVNTSAFSHAYTYVVCTSQ
jgi:hypothetical protein